MQEMSDSEKLRYKWMRYLPQKDDHPWGGYWRRLYDCIKAKIETAPLIRPLSKIFKYRTKEVRKLTTLAKDTNGEAIFPDAFPVMYVSDEYDVADLDYLEDIGGPQKVVSADEVGRD
ncbi:hypothetical protein ONZ43_g6777 [Nemania bipapillata]|uniref:Uncharacterized protein n=1 Tax=Nemania bipapillata TaxID=110536 RepID=A0ACC2HWI6_9PEZI|nr:hypothetical protein ONZ43_g6777 [Nemania bipapillata]